MKKVLVTGGVGFIGVNLIQKLLENNVKVVSIDNYSTGYKSNEIQGVKYFNYDIEEIEQIQNRDFDTCFHLAAQSRVQPSFLNPRESIRVNVNGTNRVMEWAKKRNVKVIYAGSSSKHYDPSDSPYAMSKYLGEEICKLYKKSFHVNVEIARFYNVYGPGENIDEKFGNVIGIWSAKIQNNEPIPIVGDGEQKRDFLYIKDAVPMTLWLAQNECATGLFNLGNGLARTWLDLGKSIFSALKLDEQIEFVDMPEILKDKYQYFTQAKIEKLRIQGYNYDLFSLEEAVKDYVCNYLESNQRLGA